MRAIKTAFQSAFLLVLTLGMAPAARPEDEPRSGDSVGSYGEVAGRLIDAALADHSAWDRLAELTDHFPHRLSGSGDLERAVAWALGAMREDGLQNVHGEKVVVPHWVRGAESATILEPARHALHVLGLGGSVGTPPEGLTAEVIVVESFDELERRGAEVKGKIVLFNAPYAGYGRTVPYRTQGAARAARHGAVAHLVRSVTPTSLSTPHTGAMLYEEGVPRIPSAAVTTEAAQMMARMQARGERIVLRLCMEAQTLPDAESANVVGEVVGRERPHEIVLVGGHIDGWDVGTGAMDDAGGCVATWEAVRLIKRLGLEPRRTLRVVLFTNEENGLRGGTGYAAEHEAELGNHVLAIELDSGIFRPGGVRFSGSPEALTTIEEIARLLERLGAASVRPGGGGPDIAPLVRAGVPGLTLWFENTNYMDYHHSPADTADKIDPDAMARCVAVVAVMAYVVADMPARLPTQVGGIETSR
ncbi:MAG: M20/M25/M40 family metallo-hydrolase [Planctomycetota bacterium]